MIKVTSGAFCVLNTLYIVPSSSFLRLFFVAFGDIKKCLASVASTSLCHSVASLTNGKKPYVKIEAVKSGKKNFNLTYLCLHAAHRHPRQGKKTACQAQLYRAGRPFTFKVKLFTFFIMFSFCYFSEIIKDIRIFFIYFFYILFHIFNHFFINFQKFLFF